MKSFVIFAYMIGCLIVGFILTLVVAMFRKVETNDDFRSWRWIAFFTLLAAATPYTYAEIMTKMHGDGMEKALAATLKAAEVNGDMDFFRVVKVGENTAKFVLVAREKTTLNDAQACVMKVDLIKDPKKGWKPAEYEFIDSFTRGKDSVSFPPYW